MGATGGRFGPPVFSRYDGLTMIGPRKTICRFHEPGDLHELAFSCYRRMPLLTNDVWREMLCRSIEKAITRWNFQLVAFVLMLEHVHLHAGTLRRDRLSIPACQRFTDWHQSSSIELAR